METRSKKSIKNTYTALIYSVVTILLGFFSRKVFLDTLGAEVLGLNTTATNILSFLNIAELGISSAVAFTLYTPLARADRETINEIVALQGWLYRRIAYIIILGSGVLCALFPFIFEKMELPLWYAYASFGVLLFSSLLGYFVNYKQVILSANQQEYRINNSVQSVKVAKVIVQMLGLYLLPLGYIFWLVAEVIAAIITSYSLSRAVKRDFPYLNSQISRGSELLKKHPLVTTKIKQVFFHKIAYFTTTQSSPLIIYAYLSLTAVAIYGNYMLLVTGLLILNNALNSGITAGIGNLVAHQDHTRLMIFFRELTASRYCFATILSLSLLLLSPSFMTLWFGGEYLLDNTTLLLIVAYSFIILTSTNTPFLSAFGLFGDIWAPIAEAALNIGLSIILGYFFGLPGIILGVIISLLCIIVCWKPYYLFSRGFKISVSYYIKMMVKNLSIVVISSAICYYIFPLIYHKSENIIEWLAQAIKVFTIYSAICISLFQILSSDFRLFTNRIISLLTRVRK